MKDMNYLKIIFYGLLAIVERYPFFALAVLAAIVLPPIFFPKLLWFMLGMLIIALIVIGLVWLQFRRMKRQFEREYRDAMNGNAGATNAGAGAGFNGYGFAHGMSLEDFVKQMQQQADAQQAKSNATSNTEKRSSKQDEYVDFEEIK